MLESKIIKSFNVSIVFPPICHEVMGPDAGFLAQNSAIASGAEAAIIPEDSTDVDQLAQFMERGIRIFIPCLWQGIF